MIRNLLWNEIKYIFKDYIPDKVIKYTSSASSVSAAGAAVVSSIPSVITVHKDDTLDFAISIEDPLVLIFADENSPGGCIDSGNGMQEESLFRRSALFRCLDRKYYPLGPLEAIYCKNVPVIRMSEQLNNERIPVVYCSFIASACIKYPSPNGMTSEEKTLMATKINQILDIAIINGHTNVILGAWGCGAFGCDPRQIAQLFKESISKYTGLRIYFVILGSSYNIFKDVLSQ